MSILNANALHIPLADNSVHCCITSPPYYGLRDYGADGQLGLEETPEVYIQNMVAVFREVRRVMRSDGTCWINIGDSYSGNGEKQTGRNDEGPITNRAGGSIRGGTKTRISVNTGLKPKDLIGIPWMLAFALRADGWWLRSEIIWSKPNPMPESVTDRPTKSHEQVFLLTKRANYYYDAEAIREKSHTEAGLSWDERKAISPTKNAGVSWRNDVSQACAGTLGDGISRNRRTVWEIATEPFPGSHFATFPQALVKPCLLAGSSDRGVCPRCGMPWERVVERSGGTIGKGSWHNHENDIGRGQRGGDDGNVAADAWQKGDYKISTLGWRAACSCDAGDPVPAMILDPFSGSGTVGLVAKNYGRLFVGLDLKLDYCRMAMKRIGEDAMQMRLGV